MPEKITTSITIDFSSSDGASGILKAEVDNREEGFNEGNTTFYAGDSPVFLLYKSDNVTILKIESSYGSVSSIDTGTIDQEEFLIFAGAREASPAYPIKSGFSSKWIGKSGGSVTAEESQILLTKDFTGVLKVNYKSFYTAYRLSGIPTVLDGETSFPVSIFIQGVVE